MSVFEITVPVFAILGLAASTFTCFFGERLFRVVLGLFGFFLGAGLAAALASFLSLDTEGALMVLAAIGGAVGAVVLVSAFYAGVVLVGAAGGVVLASVVSAGLDDLRIQVVVVIVLAVLGGILALKLQRVVLSLATALIGAAGMMATGLYLLIGPLLAERLAERAHRGSLLEQVDWFVIGVGALLAIFGAGVQLRTKKPPPAQRK